MKCKLYSCKPVSIIIILLLLVFPTGCSMFPSEEETLAPPLEIPEDITYMTMEAKTGYIEDSIKDRAIFVAYDEMDLFFHNNSGRLKKLYVNLGDRVKKGDVIAELLTDNIELQIAEQQITVDTKQKDLDYSKSISEIEIKMCEDEIKAIQKEYDTMLKISEVYTANELESTKTKLENQKNVLEKLKLNWSSQLNLKKSDVEAAKLKLEGLKKDYENSRIISPIDGIVTFATLIKAGEYVDSFKIIATISKPGSLRLKYTGIKANKFEVGAKVEVQTESGQTCTGEVVLTETSVPIEEMEKYKETVIIKLDEIPEGVERGNMADIKLVLNSADNTVILPINAVKKVLGKNIVYVLQDNLRVERYVETGIQTVKDIQILEGVNPGELVIIE